MSVPCTVGAVDQALEPQTLQESWRVALATDHATSWFPSGLVTLYTAKFGDKPAPLKIGDKVNVPTRYADAKLFDNVKIIGFARDASERLDLP